MSVVAFDPGMNHTGAACVSNDAQSLYDTAIFNIKAEKRDLQDRCGELRRDVRAFLERNKPRAVVVEMPAAKGIPQSAQGFGKRSALHLPTYGIAVGTVLAEAERYLEERPQREIVVLCRPSDDWTKRYPSTRGDPHKTARVRLVEGMFCLLRGSLGPESTAGNVADAILLACHGAHLITTDLPKQ
jgi:hypothetical protein